MIHVRHVYQTVHCEPVTRNYFLGRVALTTTQATESSPMHESSALQFSYNNSQLLEVFIVRRSV